MTALVQMEGLTAIYNTISTVINPAEQIFRFYFFDLVLVFKRATADMQNMKSNADAGLPMPEKCHFNILITFYSHVWN